jgi:acetyltransferase-like isoleucine patch superfamily enzyme
MSAQVVLFGAGSPIIVDVEETCRRTAIEIVAIIRNLDVPTVALNQHKIIDLARAAVELVQLPVVLPLFTPANRLHAREEAFTWGARHFLSLIDVTAILPESIVVEPGVYVNCGAKIGGASRLQEYSFINRGAVLGHHVDVGAFASVGPAAVIGAGAKIGRGTAVGAGAIILPGVTLGSNSVVGAGSVITRPVPSNTLVMGNPGRVKRRDIIGYNGKGV